SASSLLPGARARQAVGLGGVVRVSEGPGALARVRLPAYFAQACAKEVAVDFDHSAPRRPVNLNLNSDLVERCKSEVGNLSAHVEVLLAADLEKRAAAAEAEKRRTERALDAFAALYDAHGSLSKEMQSL